ncbi:hypothetical protein T265_14296, partial [Opisthorchis viverrini]
NNLDTVVEVPDTEHFVTREFDDPEYQKEKLDTKFYGTIYTKSSKCIQQTSIVRVLCISKSVARFEIPDNGQRNIGLMVPSWSSHVILIGGATTRKSRRHKSDQAPTGRVRMHTYMSVTDTHEYQCDGDTADGWHASRYMFNILFSAYGRNNLDTVVEVPNTEHFVTREFDDPEYQKEKLDTKFYGTFTQKSSKCIQQTSIVRVLCISKSVARFEIPDNGQRNIGLMVPSWSSHVILIGGATTRKSRRHKSDQAPTGRVRMHTYMSVTDTHEYQCDGDTADGWHASNRLLRTSENKLVQSTKLSNKM